MSILPEPPYYAVIFTTVHSDNNTGYAQTAEQMEQLAATQPGYLGLESASNGSEGITISYWQDEDSIRSWKANADHKSAQQAGQNKWYKSYITRVAKVERQYSFGLED